MRLLRPKQHKDAPGIPFTGTPEYAQAFERHLDIEGLAIQTAQNLPPTPAASPDPNERQIADCGRAFHRAADERYSDALHDEQMRQKAFAPHCDATRLEECCSIAEAQLHSLDSAARESVKHASQQKQHALTDLRAFKFINHVYREAVYPTNWSVHFAFALCVGVIETYANMHFLAEGLRGGLYDGLLLAAVFAGLNVALSFTAGYALRGLNSSRLRKQYILLGIVYGVFIGLYHLMISHYRMALVGNEPMRAMYTAVDRFLESPLAVTDVHSLLLLVVGIFFAGVGLWAGYTSDDSLPGYGAVSRRFQAAEQALHDEKNSYRAEIWAVIDALCDEVDQRYAAAQAAWQMYQTSLATTERLLAHWAAEARAIDAAYVRMIHRYRAAYQHIRMADLPASFQQEPAPLRGELLGQGQAALQRSQSGSLDPQTMARLHATAIAVKDRLRTLGKQKFDEAQALFNQLERAASKRPPSDDGDDAQPPLLEYHPAQKELDHAVS